MRIGKAPSLSLSPASQNGPSGSGSSPNKDDSVKRRQSFTSAVSAFAAELRSRPKKAAAFTIPRLGAAHKSTDNLSLAHATRSKSCSHLPITANNGDEPLLTLVLASTSFLDTTISESGERLYVINTKGARTNIARDDPVQGVAHVGAVTWVDENDADKPVGFRSSATIQMAHGRQYYVEDFLKRTKLTSSRLFNIPHYPHSLKWKRSGGTYKLTVAKGKATVAVLEPAVLAAPPRIKVFQTLYEHDETRPQREHRGVPVFLLDYLVVTALLVVSEKDEWLQAASGATSSTSTQTASSITRQGSIHKWRLEVQTEPFSIAEFDDSNSNSQPPSPSVPSVIDIGPSKTEDVDSDSRAADTAALRLSKHISQLVTTTTSPETFTSPGHSFSHSSLPSAVRSASAAHPHHPFANEGEDSPSSVDEFGARFSPLRCVLPPTLGVSLVDSSPSPMSSTQPSPDDQSLPQPVNKRLIMRTRSAESLADAETPRPMSKSLPATPIITRPATAGARPRESSRPFRPLPKPPQGAVVTLSNLSNERGGSNESIPPVPSLPSGLSSPENSSDLSVSEDVGLGGGRPNGSRTVSLSSIVPSPSHSFMGGLASLTASPDSESPVSSSAEGVDRPRSIRRTASETTLSVRVTTESSSPTSDSSAHSHSQCHLEEMIQRDRHRSSNNSDGSLLKNMQRRSIMRQTLVSPEDSPSAPSAPPAPSRTLSAPSVPSVPIVIPRTAPLRIRNNSNNNTRTPPPPLPTSHVQNQSHPRASTSSSVTSASSSAVPYMHMHLHSPRTPTQFHVQNEVRSRASLDSDRRPSLPEVSSSGFGSLGGVVGNRKIMGGNSEDEDGEECDVYGCGAPPAYDSIDFSHPPLKQSSFRGVG
ncbi:uncharacterized protein FOMMEDRAFT_20387 [Fomitiporia mediterranea MF3/22]|uniref:uncharacterized protein n=1 Tax=Fomitiporia mediterranea (strain MF3/22) TaxID=694068 RepID=UPI00044089FD|nr:uncharacterized protein FOMMEDRAFT_20387 [Fomitiporia mediterranea MF3/22]EJD03222.1 hypothetical protein FOMMEDRAFT_20387 [Fomitiporia mediterranea MF3/22]